MALDITNEGTSAFVTVTFYDKSGVPEDPSASTYEVHDEDTGTELVAAAALTPVSGVVEVELSGAAVDMHDATKPRETHVLTIKATHGGGQSMNAAFRYRVRNLAHVT
jgi:hypothetical protein